MPPTKTALITGASAGLGAEFARQLAAQGYAIILTARRQERLEALAAELRQQHGVAVDLLAADLAAEDGLAAVEARLRQTPDLALLVNNAGFGLRGSFPECPIDKHLAMIQVHIVAATRLAHAALPGMLARRAGGVINVASVAAFLPIRNVTYSATKAYLVNFSEALQTDLQGSGVRVQALCPGFTYTEFHDTEELADFKRSRIPGWLWLKAEAVVRDSLRSLARGPVVCVPGWQYKIAVYFARAPLSAAIVRWVGTGLKK